MQKSCIPNFAIYVREIFHEPWVGNTKTAQHFSKSLKINQVLSLIWLKEVVCSMFFHLKFELEIVWTINHNIIQTDHI